MKEHMRMYHENKKAIKDIVCKECIVKATCEDYCENMDYLIIMCADVRHHTNPSKRKAELITIAKSISE